VLLCVAFVQEKGLYLLDRELAGLRRREGRARLLVTTAFQATAPAALLLARDRGVDVRVLNPGGGSYHPKVYLGLASRRASAVVGSANLTGGLFSNVEAGVRLRGSPEAPSIRGIHAWAESLWEDERAQSWHPSLAVEATAETFEAGLGLLLRNEISKDPRFMTLGPKPAMNLVTEFNPCEMHVETGRSRPRRGGAEPIPAWMFNLAWERLRTCGRLTNAELLKDLRVHRSSAVCAILARLPGVEVVAAPRIELHWCAKARGSFSGPRQTPQPPPSSPRPCGRGWRRVRPWSSSSAPAQRAAGRSGRC